MRWPGVNSSQSRTLGSRWISTPTTTRRPNASNASSADRQAVPIAPGRGLRRAGGPAATQHPDAACVRIARHRTAGLRLALCPARTASVSRSAPAILRNDPCMGRTRRHTAEERAKRRDPRPDDPLDSSENDLCLITQPVFLRGMFWTVGPDHNKSESCFVKLIESSPQGGFISRWMHTKREYSPNSALQHTSRLTRPRGRRRGYGRSGPALLLAKSITYESNVHQDFSWEGP